jgi:ATP-binding protein involved in chromosome partitioning
MGGGEKLAASNHLPLLAEIPIDPMIGICGDGGRSLFEEAAHSKSALLFLELARKIAEIADEPKIDFLLTQGKLKIEWKDGLKREFEGKDIQQYCPCIVCRDIKNKDVGEKMEMTDVRLSGKYGLKIQFSAGCSSGIYPFAMLRKICSN